MRFLLLCLAASALLAADPSYTLVKQWQADLPGPYSGARLATAVCPEGGFYSAGDGNRMVALDTRGQIVSDVRDAAFESIAAMACTADSLYVAARTGLLIFRRDPFGRLQPLRAVRPSRGISAIAVAEPGLIFIEGPRSLHALDGQGKLLYSFRASREPSVVTRPTGQPGTLLWDDGQQRLFFIPGNRYEIQVYNREGRLLDVKTPGPQSYFQLIGPNRRPFLGQANGAALLPGGGLIIQVRNKGRFNGWPPMFLQVFDAKLDSISREVETGPGRLAGAGASGELYFLGGSAPNTLTLVKMRLAP